MKKPRFEKEWGWNSDDAEMEGGQSRTYVLQCRDEMGNAVDVVLPRRLSRKDADEWIELLRLMAPMEEEIEKCQ